MKSHQLTKGDPGKNLHQNEQPNDQTTENFRENTAVSRSNASRSWENLHQNHQGTVLGKPARTHQPNQQHTSDPVATQQQQK
ncbi:hypothetical protein Taro_016905 [Colocasia esculenta]|uniref:Uncharacterized protein n=1 Tax=Colocasia esculenta TaxID=4460 RepID=A0A843ULQ4_COLES|nr:hypothetical protein [Colocasia esculenta]